VWYLIPLQLDMFPEDVSALLSTVASRVSPPMKTVGCAKRGCEEETEADQFVLPGLGADETRTR